MRAMEDSVQCVSFCVWRLKNVFTSRNVNWLKKKTQILESITHYCV